jgi:hypothetical protein
MANGNEQTETPKKKEVEGISGGVPGNCGIYPAVATVNCEAIKKIRGPRICRGCYYDRK